MTETADASTKSHCRYCGGRHGLYELCPYVRAIEYYPDGAVKRIEFKSAEPYWAPTYAPFPHLWWDRTPANPFEIT